MGREEKTVHGEATVSRQDGATENQLWKMKEFPISEDVKECHGQSLLLKFYLRRVR